MRNLFENGVAKTKEEKLFVLNTMLSDFAEFSIIPKLIADIITKTITNDDIIIYSYVIRRDNSIDDTIMDFSFSVSDKDNHWDSAYFSTLLLHYAWYEREYLGNNGYVDRANKTFINTSDFLKEINLL